MATIDRRGITVGDTLPPLGSSDPSANLAIKTPVRVATTANITLNGLQTIDGVAVAALDRVLVKNQTDTTQNGIYLASSGNWTRTTDFDSPNEVVEGTIVFAVEGTTGTRIAWLVTTPNPIFPGTTALTFLQQIPTAVTSVFGRSGAVVAAANDYSFAQVGSKPTTIAGYGITDAMPVLRANSFGASGSANNTTGTINSSTPALVLAAASDFVNGQGIRVNHAGAAFTKGAPSSLTVTPNGTPGSTTYTYTICSLDGAGGYGATITVVATTTGNAALSTTNFNALSWSAGSGSPVGYAVYGRVAGSLQLLAVVNGTAYNDTGTAFATAPDWLLQTPPASAAADWLVTTISSGAATTSLTLAAAATTTATTQAVYHDDTAALQALANAATSIGQAAYLDNGTYYTTSTISVSGASLHLFSAGLFQGAQITCQAINSSGISIATSNGRNYLHDFQIVSGNGSTFATGGGLIATTNSSTSDVFERIFMQRASIGFNVTNNTSIYSALLIEANGACIQMASPGDSTIEKCQLTPKNNPGSTAASAVVITGDIGGLRFINNKVNTSSVFAYGINATVSISDGDFIVVGNSIEGFTSAGISIDRSGTPTFANVVIVGNQFQGNTGGRGIFFPNATGAWLSNITITGNIIGCPSDGVNIVAADNFLIEGNVFSGCSTGIVTGASTTNVTIGMNNFHSVSTQINAGSTTVYAAVTGTKPTYAT